MNMVQPEWRIKYLEQGKKVMLSICCPYCSEMRDEEEFSYSGEAHLFL